MEHHDQLTKLIGLAVILLVAVCGSACRNYNCSWEDLSPYAKLTIPEGEGPFPAIVLLHGCGGMRSSYPHRWDQRLAEWGYVSLQVDSLTSRGISSICTGGMISMEMLPYRVEDAYLARNYLATLDSVDPDRIGVMGWSHGGTTTIKAVNNSGEPTRAKPFTAAVAFYPACYKSIDPISPLLILSGAKDRWTPADFCSRHAPVGEPTDTFQIKVYSEAHHCFDWVGIDTEQQGHILKYHPRHAAEAFMEVKAFLHKNLANNVPLI